MANPDARFTGVGIRAHSLLPGDVLPGGAVVVGVDIDSPGGPGRKARITTDVGAWPVLDINDPVPTTRGLNETD